MAQLTEQQAAFVTAFTNDPAAIGNASEAARRAGYSAHSAREIGRQLLDKPHVQSAIREANQRLISGTLATKAVALLEKVIDDEEAPIKVRVEAAKTVLDRGGFGAVGSGQQTSWNRKDPSEMTEDELVEYLHSLKASLDRAHEQPAPVIDVTPKPEPQDRDPRPEALPAPAKEAVFASPPPPVPGPHKIAERAVLANPERT